jgi:hypothetical protein
MTLHLLVPLKLGNGQNDREHFRARHRRVKAEREAVQWQLNGKIPPTGPVRVLLVRVSPTSAAGWKGLDAHDNLRASMKAPVDQVAQWLGRDDADSSITWEYGQREGEWGMELYVVPVP